MGNAQRHEKTAYQENTLSTGSQRKSRIANGILLLLFSTAHGAHPLMKPWAVHFGQSVDFQKEVSREKIFSIRIYFSPGFACGRGFWNCHTNSSHSSSAQFFRSRAGFRPNQNCSLTSMIMYYLVPNR